MKISAKTLFILSPTFIFLAVSFIWYLILYQAISFFSGFTILIFLTFWQNFLAYRMSGELTKIKSKKQIFIVSLVFVLGFGELIWSISFLPFSFFILGGIVAVIFGATVDIYKEWFRKSMVDSFKIKKVLIRDVTLGAILIIIFIFISPWLPLKAL